MAPPPHRRPGFSRKAQYGLFVTYVVAIAGTIVAALLLTISVVDPTGFSALRTFGSEVTAPAARVLNNARQSSQKITHTVSAYIDAASKNVTLEKELKASRSALIEAQALRVENARLRSLLKIADEDAQQVAVGRLISSTASSTRRVATLSIGRNFGVERAQPVRGPAGLIGRVIETGPTTARVLLVTDSENLVPVMRASDGLPAFSAGLGNGLVLIKPLNLGESPFKVGDIIVTSGNGGLYSANIPFARVIRKTSEGALGLPFADPANSPYAIVMKPYLGAARAAQQAIAPDGETKEIAE
ncbi:rod shape-determining protein MreC [Sphingorhabdus wooponensis]|jgi:rod shape-determining protein MreC|uniref:Cell shape-determining protein MreC n=1 Tax=Sphingorhabdus wooponensis TaxID=940136 RepID=A0A3R8QAB4_9SPHN|nr:rod shape-determining protein MreC [Sphingorhabdus wooponensis]RRQ52613.1 rod shape-determining protein MreC [Sphingorhabdus wooponensis]